VAKRLAQKQPTRVLEIGFGTGLNFLRTAIHALNHDCHLHYTGIDIQPPPSQLALQLLAHNNRSHQSLDAFSLKNNPGLWQVPFLRKLHKSLSDDGTLGTYTVSRIFREALEQSGFAWEKLRGPAGKREVLTATKCAPVMTICRFVDISGATQVSLQSCSQVSGAMIATLIY